MYFFCSLLILCVVHAETLTKGSLLPNQERRFLWCYCVQLRNRNAISHVLKLFGLFLVRQPMSSRICFVHPSRPSLIRVFYVTLTAEQAESVQKVGRADASKEHGSEKADVEKGAATKDGVAVVAIELSMRGVCTLWPHWLQCDTMNHDRLRGSLYKQLVDYYGNILYACGAGRYGQDRKR